MLHELLHSKGKKPRTGAVLKCPVCEREFYATPARLRWGGKYCSRSCKHIGQERQARTVCVVCGIEFSLAKSMSIGRKYCGRACYLKDREPRKTCRTCGTLLKKTALTYCSQRCLFEGRRSGRMKPCEMCGKSMYVQPYLLEARRFCSYSCVNEGKRGTFKPLEERQPYLRSDGYIMVPIVSGRMKNNYQLQHRVLMERHLGRRLLPTEHVHHINGVKTDNRLDNLEIIGADVHAGISTAQGVRKRRALRDELEEYRRRYGPLA